LNNLNGLNIPSLVVFGDVVLGREAAKVAIVCVAFKRPIGIPLVILIIKGEKEPLQELIV